MKNNIKPYLVKNKIIKKLDTTIEHGFVNANISTALGALPVSNAEVSIYTWTEETGEALVKSVLTDESGKAPPIQLPVLINQGTTSPEGRTEYHLVVKAEGFHTVIIINVEIYPNISTLFNVNLTPIPRGEDSRNETITIPIQIKKNSKGGEYEK